MAECGDFDVSCVNLTLELQNFWLSYFSIKREGKQKTKLFALTREPQNATC